MKQCKKILILKKLFEEKMEVLPFLEKKGPVGKLKRMPTPDDISRHLRQDRSLNIIQDNGTIGRLLMDE